MSTEIWLIDTWESCLQRIHLFSEERPSLIRIYFKLFLHGKSSDTQYIGLLRITTMVESAFLKNLVQVQDQSDHPSA